MFKKLKQKINEEQSPQRNAQSPQQAQMGSGDRRNSQTPPFNHDGSPSPSDREGASQRPPRSPRGSINGEDSPSPQRDEPQSFAQKLQLKVPSMESLIRGGASRAESLFRSPSRESLVRSASRESLTPSGEVPESPAAPTYDPPSDIESEADEPPGSTESLSKEQLLHRLLQVETSLGKYRGKYSELVTAYRTVQRDKEKSQVVLSQSQDKALRRIGELREELQMDQQAKKHLQEEFDAALEDKDQMISVLQTQVALFKKRVKGFSGGVLPPEDEVAQSEDTPNSSSATQSPSKQEAESEVTEGEGNSDPAKLMEALQKRVKRQENLLQKCKEIMRTHKERSSQLGSENDTLQEQLQERLQELEKMKELHTTEKTKLITQLRDAKNHIEQLEQDKGMVIAETKRQMHETLEMKEEEIAQLRSRFQQATAQKEELQEQKEKAEKSAFEELERSLGVAQAAEEARKQLQVQLEEQVKNVEKASEEERKTLQQELTRVKQEVVTIMKKSSEEKLAGLEKLHSEALAAKEAEISVRVSSAVEQCKEEFSQLAKEREQQASLALEDAELQKTALRSEAENQVKEMQLELETARTRVLELESSMEKISQEGSGLSHELAGQLNEFKDKQEEKFSALEATHQEQLEKQRAALTQHHEVAVEELKEKHAVELEALAKDKELQLEAHVGDMNQKTVEKLEAKQAELEALSSELTEALASKQLLEEKLKAAEDAQSVAEKEQEERLRDQAAKHNAELADIIREKEQLLGSLEKTLQEEIKALSIILKEREKEIEKHIVQEKTLREESLAAVRELNAKVEELEQLQQTLSQSQSENGGLKESRAQLGKLTEDLQQCRGDLADLEHQAALLKSDCQQKDKSIQELEQQLQETQKEILEQKSFTAELSTKQEEHARLSKQLEDDKAALEKKMKHTVAEMEAKHKAQETKMEKIKQRAKEMQENFKKKLQKNEETLKKELAKKDTELQQKEKQVQDKILEMTQTSSLGVSTAVAELQARHSVEVEELRGSHKRECEELESRWRERLGQQEEELAEKHSLALQERAQELEELSAQLGSSREESERVACELKDLKEELAIRETTVQKLQEELNGAAVELERLAQGEASLREQMDSAERNLNQAMNERNALQDQLSRVEEAGREESRALSKKADEAEWQLRDLEEARQKEGEYLRSTLEAAALQLQAKDAERQQQLALFGDQLERCCQEAGSRVEGASNELCRRVELKLNELKDRLLRSQEKVGRLRGALATKAERICTLEETLRQRAEENENLCISLAQATAQVNAHGEHVQALTQERAVREASVDVELRRIEELSEANRVLSEGAEAKEAHVGDLESRLEVSAREKEEAINQLHQRHEARLGELEREIGEKDNALQSLRASADSHSVSKSEMDQALSEKEMRVSDLASELESCGGLLAELREQLAAKTKECEQLAADLERQRGAGEAEEPGLAGQLQQNGSAEPESPGQLHALHEDHRRRELELERQLEEHEKIKEDAARSTEESLKAAEERMLAESARKVSELKRKAEQRIAHIKKQLTSQLEDKEQAIAALRATLEETKGSEASGRLHADALEARATELEEAFVKLKEEQETQLEKIRDDGSLEKEKSLVELRRTYEDRLSALEADGAQQGERREAALRQVEAELKDAAERNEKLLAEMARLKEEARAMEAQMTQQRAAAEAKAESGGTETLTLRRGDDGGGCGGPLESLEARLSQTTSEKEKIQKDFGRLQKDIRLLRKEHEQDIEYMKKELSEENEKRLKLELEDMQMKHNSGIKQLMREFNTQMALKERELDSAVKEAIAKAQSVESELITCHREEASQLRGLISQKEDDLHRTVQKYEEVIQSREEEMGERVWQVQKELEELQAKSLGPSEMSREELQTHLAEKTTLLSEARLKEQGFTERIHSLEDKIKCFSRKTVVTHLGSSFKDPGFNQALSEHAEVEYLRKVLFEYMMGRETKTMAKVITSMLKFPPDQAQKVLDKEDTKNIPWLR